MRMFESISSKTHQVRLPHGSNRTSVDDVTDQVTSITTFGSESLFVCRKMRTEMPATADLA